MLKPKKHECQVAEGDEVFTFYVREPSGREMLELAAKQKNEKEKGAIDKPAIDNARELFSRYIVNHDGTAISKEEVESILDMRLSAMQKVSEIVQEKIGIKNEEKKS